jgi:hypothetical protein
MPTPADQDMEVLRTPTPEERVVYSPEGKRAVLSTPNAHDRVQHLGWSYSQAKAPTVRETQKVTVLVSKTAAPKVDAKPEETDEVDLSSMEAPELIAFAKTHFDMDFKSDVKKEDVLAAILQEQTT